MAEYRQTLTLRPLGLLDRLWYWHIGAKVCEGALTSKEEGRLARLVPYRWRRWHERYAKGHGYFWIPCPLCDRPFGGHEGAGSVPDPTRGPTAGVTICSRCTRVRNKAGVPSW